MSELCCWGMLLSKRMSCQARLGNHLVMEKFLPQQLSTLKGCQFDLQMHLVSPESQISALCRDESFCLCYSVRLFGWLWVTSSNDDRPRCVPRCCTATAFKVVIFYLVFILWEARMSIQRNTIISIPPLSLPIPFVTSPTPSEDSMP